MTVTIEEIHSSTIKDLEQDFEQLVFCQKELFIKAVECSVEGHIPLVFALKEQSEKTYQKHALYAFRTLNISDLPLGIQKEIASNYLKVKDWCGEQFDIALENALKIFSKQF